MGNTKRTIHASSLAAVMIMASALCSCSNEEIKTYSLSDVFKHEYSGLTHDYRDISTITCAQIVDHQIIKKTLAVDQHRAFWEALDVKYVDYREDRPGTGTTIKTYTLYFLDERPFFTIWCRDDGKITIADASYDMEMIRFMSAVGVFPEDIPE